MIKRIALIAIAVALPFAFRGKAVTSSGSWQVDAGHSTGQFFAEGTTDSGKAKQTFEIGLGRVSGTVKMDAADPSKSAFDIRIYPASTMEPPINEEGRVQNRWLLTRANQTLVCFHSKKVTGNGGRMQAEGDLVLTRVDRNVEVTASNAYSGPVYGPAMIHRVTRPASFVFDLSDAGSGATRASGTAKVFREDFPGLVRSVLGTYWPPLIEQEKCTAPAAASDAYSSVHCTGMFMQRPTLPSAPFAGDDYPGPADFNSVVGNQVNIVIHMQLKPVSASKAAAGN